MPIDDASDSGPTLGGASARSSSSSSRWTPWTHRPLCINGSVRAPGDDGGSGGAGVARKFCVYTNSRHGIGGLSIITTPENAADNIDVLNEPVLPHIPGNKEWQEKGGSAGTNGGTTSLPYEIVDLPGKGKGVVATRPIAKYETIMTDYASVLVSMEFPTAVGREQGYALLQTAADQLGDPARVLTLGRSMGSVAGHIIEDVLRTNAFHTELGGGEAPHMVLYPLVSVSGVLPSMRAAAGIC